MPTIKCQTSIGPLGGHVHIFVYLQVHPTPRKDRRAGNTHGVRRAAFCINPLVDHNMVPNGYSFENALLSREPTPILTKILARFVLNLRPQTRNLRCVRVPTRFEYAANTLRMLWGIPARIRSQQLWQLCCPNTSNHPREPCSGTMT